MVTIPPLTNNMFEEIPKKPTRKYKGTPKQIYDLMVENTGRNMLDSGDHYGRNWEKNRKNDFDQKPAAVFSFDHDGKLDSIHANLFHFLSEWMEYDPKAQREFSRFCKKEFAELEEIGASFSIDEKLEKFVESKDQNWGSCNTHNEENCLLTGVLDITKYHDEDRGEDIFFIRHHGGFDLRAGYSTPKAFTCVDSDILDTAWGQALASCECGNCDVSSNNEIDDCSEWTGEKTNNGWPAAWVKHASIPGAAFCESCKQTVSTDISRH